MNFPVLVSFDDGINVRDGQFELNAILLAGLAVTSNPAKTVYRTGECISYSGLAVTAIYTDNSTADVTSMCSINPPENTEIDSDITAEISYSEGQDKQSATLQLTHLYLTGINITQQLDKNMYKTGEIISYEGLAVTAFYSDGTSEDITASCTITPRAGKPFDPETDSYVEISFDDNSSAMIQLNELYLTGLSVSSNPEKTAYIKGEYIDYTGLIVTASYSDSSSEDVTASCSITPQEGKQFDPDTDTNAEVTYSEGSITETAGFMFTEIYMTGLQVTSNPLKTAYKHEEIISYEGLVVTANYSNGTSEDVTSKCSIIPAEGKPFDAETDTYAEITYSQGDSEANCMLTLTPILLTSLAVTTAPHKFAYVAGEHIDYTGIAVTASYSDKTIAVVTGKCTFSASQGKPFSPDTDTNITITYAEGRNEMTCSLTLGETSMTLIVSAMPTKTIYQPGEALDLAGLVIKAVHLDSSQHNVTDFCEFPSEINGSEIKVSAKCETPPSPYIFDHRGGYVDNGSWVISSSKYSDIYTVEAGHKYLLAGSSFNAMFTKHDVSKTEGNVAGTAVEVVNNPDGYACAEFTPSFSGYLIASKDSGGLRTYLYDAQSSNKNVTAEFSLSTVAVTALDVTKPVKTRYRTGETLDLTGAAVTAVYSDESTEDVTSSATFSPADGTVITEDINENVSISYTDQWNENASGCFSLNVVTLQSELQITPPEKTSYRQGEAIDYTGVTVTAVYSDGSIVDVTSSAVFSPANSTVITEDMTGSVSVSYTNEWS